MNARAQTILARFPAHLEAARPGKRLGEVTNALALEIEALNVALARVRKSRRLLEADELVDLLQLGALHGVRASELAVLFARFAVARGALQDAGTSDEAAERLVATWGIAEAAPRLSKFGSRQALIGFCERALRNRQLLDAARRRIGAICGNHARGNGTVRALIEGAANALDLDVRAVRHSDDRYVHMASVVDRLHLQHPTESAVGEETFAPLPERLIVEENPRCPAQTNDVARKHGELFSVLRRGFDRETLRVVVTGVEQRTVGPMLVNRDEGRGVGFAGAVPNGVELDFTEEGRVLLGGVDVTSQSYAWQGACFADGTSAHPADFVFDGPGVNGSRRARFAEASPAGALGSVFTFPHAGDGLPMPGIALGETRFAFFVREAHFSRREAGPPPSVERVQPRHKLGAFESSLYAAGPSEARATAAVVRLAWHERVAFWVNVWIPKRFRGLTPDDEEGRDTLAAVALALERFRPAGVRVDVKFLDDRWVLGQGVTFSEQGGDDQVAGPGAGTELWAAPAE